MGQRSSVAFPSSNRVGDWDSRASPCPSEVADHPYKTTVKERKMSAMGPKDSRFRLILDLGRRTMNQRDGQMVTPVLSQWAGRVIGRSSRGSECDGSTLFGSYAVPFHRGHAATRDHRSAPYERDRHEIVFQVRCRKYRCAVPFSRAEHYNGPS